MSSAILRRGQPGLVRAAAALTYAVLAYLVFLVAFLAFVAFVGGLLPRGPAATASPGRAALVDLGLVLLFGLQHSVMARPAFKRAWIRVVPEPIERSVYVLAASLTLVGVVALWQTLPGTVWRIESTVGVGAIWAIFASGWAMVLLTSFLIDHFELFGLRQAWSYATGRSVPKPTFRTPSVYRLVRHPMQLGFVIALWAAPTMTVDRLAIAALLTAYICLALIFEERDLVAAFGDQYRVYQKHVPRLLPRFRPR